MSPQDGDERLYYLALALILGTLLMTVLVVAGGLWWAFDAVTQTMTFDLKDYP